MPALALSACGCWFAIQCPDDETTTLVDAAFGGMTERWSSNATPAGSYRIERVRGSTGFHVEDDGGASALADADGLLFHLDKSLTLALQRHRPDLYFIHAAAVARDDWTGVLAAPPGTGKSTLTLALLDMGFVYLSDELAPIDVHSLLVHPYPHAVCLKSQPPAPYRVPSGALSTGDRIHVPTSVLGGRVASDPRHVSAFIFLRRESRSAPLSGRLGTAAGVAHLTANALNSLAHPGDGLEAAFSLARRVPCVVLSTHDLRAACAEIERIAADQSSCA